MSETHHPKTAQDLCDLFQSATSDNVKLRLRGGGSKDPIGRPTPDAHIVDMRGFSGIEEYDPPELVLTVKPGTSLAEVEKLVAAEGQMLAFAPFDHGPLFGTETGKATIGGVIAAGVAGPSRLSRGGARDHLLGLEAVSGRGETFVAGAKVVKNVTGYDLPKLMTGSWGRLAALTQITLKVLPQPEESTTLVMAGLNPTEAIADMAKALGSSADVSAAAHLPNWQGNGPTTALRLDGIRESITARIQMLTKVLGAGRLDVLGEKEASLLWDNVQYAKPLPQAVPLWRIVIPPSQTSSFIATFNFAEHAFDWIFDWAGGLIWAATDAPAADIWATAKKAGGHARLIRADAALQSSIPMFSPQSAMIEELEKRVRRAFDPAGIFETGRF